MIKRVVWKKQGFTSFTIKIIAVLAMLIDHTAWAFVPLHSVSGQLMHMIGRITMPVMCFFVAEGYFKTRNVKKYALRLFIFSLVSYYPFIYFEAGGMPNGFGLFKLNVGFDLLAGLLALWAWNKLCNPLLRLLTMGGAFALSILADWSIFGVGFILLFGIFHGNFKKQAVSFSIWGGAMVLFCIFGLPLAKLFTGETLCFPYQMAAMQLFQSGIFLALPLLRYYSGEQGGRKYGKWVFYVFYPLHLFVLGAIKGLLLG